MSSKLDDSANPQLLKKQIVTMCKIMRTYPDDENISGAAAAALGAINGKHLKESKDFSNLVGQLVADIGSGDQERIKIAIRSTANITRGADANVTGLFVQAGAVAALFKALDEHGHNKDIREDILTSLHAFASEFKFV